MRRFVAPGPPILPYGILSVLRRTPGISTIRMRCPASGHSIVQKNSLARSLTGLSGACAAPLTALRPHSQSKRRQANRLIQAMNRYWDRAPQKRSPIKVLPSRVRWTNGLQLLLQCNRKALGALRAIQPQLGVVHTEAHGLARLSTKCYSLRLCRSIDRPPTEV